MNWITPYLGLIAGAIALFAFIPFIVAILKGKAKPSIVTWTTWSVVNILLIKSYYDSGAHNTLWIPLAFLTGDVIIFLLCLKFGEKTITPFDAVVIVITSINILGIMIFSYNKYVVLALSVIALVAGGLPTIRKAWLRPQYENKLAWSMFGFAAIINLLSIEDWSHVEIIAHPLYVFSIDVSVAVILWIKGNVKSYTLSYVDDNHVNNINMNFNIEEKLKELNQEEVLEMPDGHCFEVIQKINNDYGIFKNYGSITSEYFSTQNKSNASKPLIYKISKVKGVDVNDYVGKFIYLSVDGDELKTLKQ